MGATSSHRDLKQLAQRGNLQHLGDPMEAAESWAVFIQNSGDDWNRIVDALVYTESKLDREVPLPTSIPNTWVCQVCTVHAFPTRKALSAHQRTKHGMKSPMRFGADATGVCPVCLTSFSSRIRLLYHLTDGRRTKCGDAIEAGTYPELSQSRVDELDESDRLETRGVYREGRTQVKSKGQAFASSGRLVSRVSV